MLTFEEGAEGFALVVSGRDGSEKQRTPVADARPRAAAPRAAPRDRPRPPQISAATRLAADVA